MTVEEIEDILRKNITFVTRNNRAALTIEKAAKKIMEAIQKETKNG